MSDPNMKKQTTFENGKTQTGKNGAVPSLEVSPLTGDVYISYRQYNSDLLDPVLRELKKRGFSYFIDSERINYGMAYSETKAKAISSFKLMLLFWTPDVKDCSDIIREVEIAKEHKKPFIIYKVGDFARDGQRKLQDQIAEYSCYEVPQQTPETIVELADWIQQLLYSSFPVNIVTFGAVGAAVGSAVGTVGTAAAAATRGAALATAPAVGFWGRFLNYFSRKPVLLKEQIVDNDPVVLQPKLMAPVSGDVFISYRSHNLGLVEPILKELKKRGISYFIDREKLKSGNYSRKISVAINSCKILFLFWTEDVDDSKYIPNEIHLAFEWGKEIIPYKVGNFDIDKQFSVIFYLKSLHILEESQDSITEVVDSIQQALIDIS